MKTQKIMSKTENRFKLIVAAMLLTAGTAFSQQDPMYNQYLFNAYTINAAEAGARNYGTVSSLYRWQWVGIDGAPNTGSVGIETSIGKGWGLGFNVIDDRIGPTSNLTVNLSSAYHISLTEKLRMSVGVNLVGNNQRVMLSRIQELIDLDDPTLSNNIQSFNPNVGGGVLLYTERGFLGASMPRFIEYKLTDQSLVSIDQLRHIFLYGGKVFDVAPNIKFKPSVLTKIVTGAPVEFDLNGVISLYNHFDVGANWRSGDGIGFMVGLTIRERLVLNYAYEFPMTDIRYASMQTHEVGVRYRFSRANFERIQSPRFFN